MISTPLALPLMLLCAASSNPSPVREVLDEAARVIPASFRSTLAAKPSPYVVKTHDVGEPTDVHRDIPWHIIDKERDPRFVLPHAGRLGLFNTNTDINFLLGFGRGETIDFNPARRITDHLVNLVACEVTLPGARADVLLMPVASDTLLAVIAIENSAPHAQVIAVGALCDKPEADQPRPVDRFGYGITATTGRLREARREGESLIALYDEWRPKDETPFGTLLCAMRGSEPVAGDVPTPASRPATSGGVLTWHVNLQPRERQTLRIALHLRRFAPEAFDTRNKIVLYHAESPGTAAESAAAALDRALSSDWAALVKKSYAWYARMPRFTLPHDSWTAAIACALELPRGNTWSPQEQIATPWYTFCRVHGHEPYGWWSYGMHAHEHLATAVVNLTEPSLSAGYLRGHFQVQKPDGEIQYGVNHRLANIHRGLATAPLLMGEAWDTWLWGGDRTFLEQAYAAGARYVRWWRSPARTRDGNTLQHWRDFVESVRDDKDLATWAATGGAEHQSALDLNCYLLNEERTLARMARALGRDAEADAWDADAEHRTLTMREQLWHAEDELYYGREPGGGRWARVLDISTFLPLWSGLAEPEQVPGIVRLLHDLQAFGTPYPVATLGVRHMPEKLRGVYHWRGANWVEMSWLVVRGLRRAGQDAEAARLAEINCRMVFDTLERTGHFREYYNTLTGEPSDLTDYIWTALPAAMVVEAFYGVQPAAEGLYIRPALPPAWDRLSVENLRVREAKLALEIRRGPGQPSATLNGTDLPIGPEGVHIPWERLPPEAAIVIRLP